MGTPFDALFSPEPRMGPMAGRAIGKEPMTPNWKAYTAPAAPAAAQGAPGGAAPQLKAPPQPAAPRRPDGLPAGRTGQFARPIDQALQGVESPDLQQAVGAQPQQADPGLAEAYAQEMERAMLMIQRTFQDPGAPISLRVRAHDYANEVANELIQLGRQDAVEAAIAKYGQEQKNEFGATDGSEKEEGPAPKRGRPR